MQIHNPLAASSWQNGNTDPADPAQLASAPPSPIRVAIVDDHPIMRQGLIYTFQREPGFEVVGQGGSGADALRIAEIALPDVLLLDISMPGNGVEAAKAISRSFPAVRIVMLTALDSEQHVTEALRGGACGFVVKGISSNELIGTVRSVYEGAGYVSPALAAKLLNRRGTTPAQRAAPRVVDLISREEEILKLVCDGHTNRAIGERLGLSEKTIKHYMTNILRKLHARNRVEAALIGRERLSNSA